MGFFRDLGRRVEEFKRQAEAAADATHVCADCDAELPASAEECPECGSGEIVERPD